MKNEELLKLLNNLTDASLELISITKSKNDTNIAKSKNSDRRLTDDKYSEKNKANRDINKNNCQRICQ